MTTEQEIQQIGERLQQLINTDNDAPRFIREYAPFITHKDDVKIEGLEQQIEDLEEKIEDAIRALS